MWIILSALGALLPYAVAAVERTHTEDMYQAVPAPATVLRDYGQEIAGINQRVVDLASSYLRGLRTFQAEFTQYDAHLALLQTGKFYLVRPKQFLWQYETPQPQKLVATGSRLFYVDDIGGQVTQLPLNSGLAAVFLNEDLDLNRPPFNVLRANETLDAFRVTVALPNTDALSVDAVELIFQKEPLQLAGLITINSLGQETALEFANAHRNWSVDPNLFNYTPPLENDFQWRN